MKKIHSYHIHLAVLVAVIVGGYLLLKPQIPNPGQATATLVVTASVVPKCMFKGSGGQLNFGEYDPVGVNATNPLDVNGSFDIKCTKNTTCQLGIGFGQHASGSVRRMISGANYLNYEIYKEASRTSVWTDTGAGRVPFTALTSQYYTEIVYGRIPGGQDVAVGAYDDTCVLTADF